MQVISLSSRYQDTPRSLRPHWHFVLHHLYHEGFPGGSDSNLLAMQETWVWSLGQEDPLPMGMATHSSILACRIPWTEEPGSLQSMGLQRFRHDWETNTFTKIPSEVLDHTNTFLHHLYSDFLKNRKQQLWKGVFSEMQNYFRLRHDPQLFQKSEWKTEKKTIADMPEFRDL